MNILVENKIEALRELCAKYSVKRLELFGSATGEDFDPESSDLDFLVKFESCSPSDHYEHYFGLLESLENLYDRKIDLVEEDAMRNPYFIRRVNQSRLPIYET